MTIGKRNERIDIVSYTHTKSEVGTAVIVEADRQTLWANVENRTGHVTYDKNAVLNLYDYKITTEYYPSFEIKNEYKVDYKGKVLKIISVQIVDEGKRKFNVLRCSHVED